MREANSPRHRQRDALPRHYPPARVPAWGAAGAGHASGRGLRAQALIITSSKQTVAALRTTVLGPRRTLRLRRGVWREPRGRRSEAPLKVQCIDGKRHAWVCAECARMCHAHEARRLSLRTPGLSVRTCGHVFHLPRSPSLCTCQWLSLDVHLPADAFVDLRCCGKRLPAPRGKVHARHTVSADAGRSARHAGGEALQAPRGQSASAGGAAAREAHAACATGSAPRWPVWVC